MLSMLERAIRRACHYLLDRSINLYSPERQSWGRAASAEVHVMPSLFATVSWTLGALWAALKAWVARLLARPSNLFLGSNSLLRFSWRSLSPLFLVLSMGLFLAPQFREALRTTTSMWIAGNDLPELSARRFHTLQVMGERQHDAQTLAFLALRTQDKQNSLRLAEEAVALDQNLTWIFAEFPLWDRDNLLALLQRLERLERWDPDNALPFLLHADFLEYSAQFSTHQDQSKVLAAMRNGESEFRHLMERAFAAPRYDSYLSRRFELDRQVMRKHGIAEPLLLLGGLQRQRTANVFHTRTYAGWLMEEARDAIKDGNLAVAIEKYRRIIATGGHLQTKFSTWPEQITGISLQQSAGNELLPILRQQDKVDEASTLEALLRQQWQSWEREDILLATVLDPGKVRLDRADPLNPGVIIHVSALLFVFALALMLSMLLYLRLHPAKGTAVLLPRMISYTPVVVFSSALVLLVTYLPYARIFRMYMTDARLLHLRLVPPGMPHATGSGGVDFSLLSSLSNLQYPFHFLAASDVWWIMGGASAAVLVLGAYAFWRTRAATASA